MAEPCFNCVGRGFVADFQGYTWKCQRCNGSGEEYELAEYLQDDAWVCDHAHCGPQPEEWASDGL